MKYVGIDIGGMTIKGGIVDEKGNILARKVVVTSPGKEDYLIVQDIANLIEDLTKDCKDEIEGIGIGCPGSIYDEKGVVRYSCNINFRNTPMAKMIAEKTQIKNVKLSNDANCAALGETLFGAGEGAKNSVMVTLGTGVGTGIIADGRLITGHPSAGWGRGQSLGRCGRRTYNNQSRRRDLRLRKERLLRGVRFGNRAYESDSIRLRKAPRQFACKRGRGKRQQRQNSV